MTLSPPFTSLTAVVARFLIGLLASRSPSFFEKHKPVTFSTIATPVSADLSAVFVPRTLTLAPWCPTLQ